MTTTVGVDIGGSSVTAVARTHSGEIVARHEMRTAVEGGHQIVNLTVAAVRALAIDDFDAVGVGIPGQVDPETGEVTMAVNLGIGASSFHLAAELESLFDRPVTIENDVRAAALGAYDALTRAGRSPQSLLLTSIGTGISAGLVVNGAVIRGSHGIAGEIGHVVVDESGPLCRCGQRGCLEALAAGPAIARAWPKGPEGSAASALFAAVAAHDAAAEKVATRVTGHLTTALIWMAAAYDPELIVLAGGVATAGSQFLGMVRDHVVRLGEVSELAARRLKPEQITIVEASDPPGPRGAALLALNNISILRESPAATKASNET